MNNTLFEKTMENVRNCRDNNLGTTEARRNFMLSVPNNHTDFFQKIY